MNNYSQVKLSILCTWTDAFIPFPLFEVASFLAEAPLRSNAWFHWRELDEMRCFRLRLGEWCSARGWLMFCKLLIVFALSVAETHLLIQ